MGRGRVLLACTVGNAVSVTPAVHAVFGLFLVPLSDAFGWPRASISVVLGILAAGGALIYPLVGRYVDGHGARRALIIGIIGLALSIAALALTNGSLVQFYATFAMISVFGAIGGTPIFQKVVADWFDQGRGTALGISAGVGNGVGSVILPVLAATLMAAYGWRSAYLGIAAAMLLVAVPVLVLLLRDRSTAGGTGEGEAQAGLALAEAARLPAFWLTLIAIASGAGCTTAIFSHVVPILGDRGFDVATGTAVVSVFALVTSGWQIATGRILDKVPTPRIVVPMYLMAVAGLALLQLGQGMAALIVGGVLLGIGLGSQFGALPYFIARYFGLRSFGTIIGAMYSAVIVAQGFTPVLLDAAFDAQQTYAHALVAAGACLIVGALLLLLLPRFDDRAAPADKLAFHGA
ncbi:MFS family permease [Sphingomonas zeicaulis]|uniref:MFS transporter n=1 Tax=Sphingomonas zeicaulis TaxID=1632740 RepID=UPI003D22A5E4